MILLVPFLFITLEVNGISKDKDKDIQVNHEIKAREVRLIGPDGKQLGIMPLKDALRYAQEAQLDLVKIASNAKPPVCKIMDFGKYKYELSKKEKEVKKKQKVISVKEVRLTPKIEEHDLAVKANHAIKFLQNKDRVKVTLRFRGREVGYVQLGYDVMEKFSKLIPSDIGVVEKKPVMEGKNMIMFLAPKND